MDIIGQHLGKIIDLIAHLQEERKEKLRGKVDLEGHLGQEGVSGQVRQSWTWQRDLGAGRQGLHRQHSLFAFLFLIKCVAVILQAYMNRGTRGTNQPFLRITSLLRTNFKVKEMKSVKSCFNQPGLRETGSVVRDSPGSRSRTGG